MFLFDNKRVYEFMNNLNSDLLAIVLTLRQEPIVAGLSMRETKARLLALKQKMSDIYYKNLRQKVSCNSIEPKKFIDALNNQYTNDQQFIELLKNYNSTMDMLKQQIRHKLNRALPDD